MSVKKSLTVAVLHNQVGTDSTRDELDVIVQVNAVIQSLSELGYDPVVVPLSLNFEATANRLKSINPEFVFNLVESVDGSGRLIYFAPALLDKMGYIYTGSCTNTLYLTTNKPLAKSWMHWHNIATPAWTLINRSSRAEPDFKPPYILKPVWEDASVGLDAASVFDSRDRLHKHIRKNQEKNGEWFAEAYIPGREFNISILANSDGAEILPVAEIEFVDYPADRPKIVDYRAKWETESFEYQHTVRSFDFSAVDELLLADLRMITRQCWNIFNLHGYARVDFRVDEQGKAWVLEINANPCISPDSGFAAAAERAGLEYTTVIKRIIEDIPLS
jgi:D-alanine-D-alanine ligase